MDFLQELNPRQREAVEHTDGPLLILAGAGSGKTRVITYRIAHLIRHRGVWPPAILAVTFTNKAAEEMRDRVRRLLGDAGASPWLSTFHSFCVRLLRRDGAPLAEVRPGFTTQFSIYDDDEQAAVVRGVYRELGLDEKFLSYRTALSRIGYAKNQRTSPAEYAREARHPQGEKLAVIYERYEQALRRANALDFDDLLLEAVRLLRSDEATQRRVRERFHYLMVDEYQDTNRTQYELMRLLTGPQPNLCVVGDEDQSIYGWRGADIRNILDFERDFPGAALIRLEQNYRSTGNILEAASRVVAHNQQRVGKTLWTEAAAGERILVYCGEDAEAEALFIADCIERYLREHPGERVGVLYRTNSQSRPIEEALRRCGRRYLLVGGLSFYQRAEVKDLLAYLKAAVSPQDTVSLLRIINTPARGIGRSTIEQIEQHARERNLPMWEAIEDLLAGGGLSSRASAAVDGFRALLEEARARLREHPLSDALVWLKERTGYRRMLEQEDTAQSEGRLENINELINAAADAVQRGETIQEFLDHAALVAEADDVDERAAVTLLTLHSAKGLEFSLVILAGMEEGLFPHSRSTDAGTGVEEERRLCYVGLTRAQKQLVLTRAFSRRRYGGGEYSESAPSRFLAELPAKLRQDLTPAFPARRSAAGMDLYAEQQAVREIARRNAFAGRTYNSVEAVNDFFAGRRPPPAPPPKPAPAAIGRPLPAGFRAGARVRHPKYGAGVVLRLEGEGDDAKLTVNFSQHGVRKVIQKYANLNQE